MTPHYVNQGGELNWLLDDLVKRVPQVSKAVMLTQDGLAIGASASLNREDAEHLAALAAGFQSMARGAGSALRRGAGPPDHHRDGGRLPLRQRGRPGDLPRRAQHGRRGRGPGRLRDGRPRPPFQRASGCRPAARRIPAGPPGLLPGAAAAAPAVDGGQQRHDAALPGAATSRDAARRAAALWAGGPGHRVSVPAGRPDAPPSMGTASAPLAQLTPQPRDAAPPDSVYSPYPTPAGRPPSAPYTE